MGRPLTRKPDFEGWATKCNIRCSDGRTIKPGAFRDDDGQTVPVVWMHNHNSPEMVLGHAILEDCGADGVYTYGFFNNSKLANEARECVEHGDITALSIYANQLKQQSGDVLHGHIREVSLVMAGANPGACIINGGDVEHADADDFSTAIIYNEDDSAWLSHSDDDDEEESNMPNIQEALDSMNEEQLEATYALLGMVADEAGLNLEDDDEEDGYDEYDYDDTDDDEDFDEETFDYAYAAGYEAAMQHSDEGGNDMYSVFSGQGGDTLTHSEFNAIVSDSLNDVKTFNGSLKDSFFAHAAEAGLDADFLMHDDTPTYGVTPIDYLFPNARELNIPPEFIKRDTDWVSGVMSGVHKTPFSKVKTTFADITGDAARAKGYMKGSLKKEEVFTLLKRETGPCTIYKKQKMDRDDIIDIVDFDVVSWIKGEMRLMLDEEIARAILVGDGRLVDDEFKIKEDCIRPIWKDADLYSIKAAVEVANDADEDTIANAMIRKSIKARKDYKGSGNPTLYTTESQLADMLLLEDGVGRLKYTLETLKQAMRVTNIVTVPVMENLVRTFTVTEGGVQKTYSRPLLGIIVNLKDYNVGADKGGAVSLFDDFDINYNQQIYLIETRCSGALVKPYSAIILELDRKAAS